jgi:hypothetical protein
VATGFTVFIAVAFLSAIVLLSAKTPGGMAQRSKRSGLPDPTWQQGGIALIAIGAFFVGVTAATQTAPAPGHRQPVSPLLWVGLAITGLGVLVILVSFVGAYSRRKEDRNPPFTLSHDPNDQECDFWQNGGRTLRVVVRNTSSMGVARVRVQMTPEHGHAYFLHIRHDNEPLRNLSRTGEMLTVDQDEYFDVVCAFQGHMIFNYADRAIEAGSATPISQTVRVALTASGWRNERDVVPLTKTFDVTFVSPDGLTMTEVTQ